MADDTGRASRNALVEQYIKRTLANFPFPYETVSGKDALGRWEALSRAKKGAPIVAGSQESFYQMLDVFSPGYWSGSKQSEPTVAETLVKADALTHPESIMHLRQKEQADLDQYQAAHPDTQKGFASVTVVRNKDDLDKLLKSPPDPKHLGFTVVEIPSDADLSDPSDPSDPFDPSHLAELKRAAAKMPMLTVAWDALTGKFYDSVYIVTVPTDDWTTAPAYLRWGGWNANPPPEYHVAAFRSWRDRFGAELIGMGADTINMRVKSKPPSREDALTLAKEQYAYCPDIVDQGTGSVEALADGLLSSDWWMFWWD